MCEDTLRSHGSSENRNADVEQDLKKKKQKKQSVRNSEKTQKKEKASRSMSDLQVEYLMKSVLACSTGALGHKFTMWGFDFLLGPGNGELFIE